MVVIVFAVILQYFYAYNTYDIKYNNNYNSNIHGYVLTCINTLIPVIFEFVFTTLPQPQNKIHFKTTNKQIYTYTTIKNTKKCCNNLAHTMSMPNHAQSISVYSYN